ncbi:hypothetical protein H4582DRAFT_2075212 [Lactarius indigo]|nr:hypothetical protein H4582DRAFT_2075212 [Lactarius indigo]
MAGPLRRVSQNYNWTLKRAHNDLHNSITSEPPPTAAASPNAEAVVFPWDSAGLQWKFKNEYDELRELLGRSLLILVGWWLTIGNLVEQFVVSVLDFRISASQTLIPIPKADRAISRVYKQSAKPSIRDTLSITVWGLLAPLFPIPISKAQPDQPVSHLHKKSAELSIRDVSIAVWGLFFPLFRYAMPRIAIPTQHFFSRLANAFGADKSEESDIDPASSPSARRPLLDEQPEPDQSPNIESTAHEHPEDSPTITVMSDPAYSALDGPLMDTLKDGLERLQSAVHMGKGMLFYGSPTLGGDIGKPYETKLDPIDRNTTGLNSPHFSQSSPNPTQDQGSFRVIITRPQTDDSTASGD